MNIVYKETASLFRKKRETLELTQGQIANKSQCSLAVISKLERGLSNYITKILEDTPTASRILKAYKIDTKELREPLLVDEEKKIDAAIALLNITHH